MSAPQDNRNEKVPSAAAAAATAEESKDTEQEANKNAKSPKDQKKPLAGSKNAGWQQPQIMRGAGADVMAFRQDVMKNIQPGLQQMLALPTLDPSLHPFDLVPSRFNNDLEGTLQEVNNFLLTIDPFAKMEFPNFFGCWTESTKARFSIYTYVDQGQIVFYLRQYDGCGIAFSHFFKRFNQEFGITPNLPLHSFDQPPTEPLTEAQLAEIDARYSKQQDPNGGQCVAPSDHLISWAVETITTIRQSIVDNARLSAVGDSEDGHFAPHQLLINKSTMSMTNQAPAEHVEDVVDAPLPLTNEAQSRMLDQAFSSLNGVLDTVAQNGGEGLEPHEVELVGNLLLDLCQLEDNVFDPPECRELELVPKFYAFDKHPMLDVKVGAVCFVAAAIQAGVAPQEAIEDLSPLFHHIYEISCESLLRSDPNTVAEEERINLNPFERISHEKICYTIQSLHPE